ncbi:MAG: chromosomal replication initiator protein DnaA [Candidatus Sumerlaeia bacterium]|nr:chromosomal replication initiator protein DnaA [Candidatus Sumerlaeia bacterium]
MKAFSDIIWGQAMFRLRHLLDQESYATWITPIKFCSFQDNVCQLEVPNKFYKHWLMTNYLDKITNVLQQLTKSECTVKIICPDDDEELKTQDMFLRLTDAGLTELTSSSVIPPLNFEDSLSLITSRLNPQYTFENFVVGESNRFAHAVAQAVADTSTRAYNPLFIYGGVGLGKTHLMQAIGHKLLANSSNAKVVYVSSEQFMNCFIDSISKNKQAGFRNYFRSADLLLIDDVQFLIGKDRTQTEFFHTFNALYDASKKIVISSDRPPKELANIEERLRSRFEWGIIVDIQPPELETRIAILKRKAESQNLTIPPEVTYYIAERITSNIRELEGSLKRIKAYAELHKQPITLELTKKLLSHLEAKEEKKEINIDQIIRIVAEYFDIRPQDILGDSRERRFAIPRHIAQYLARELTSLSLPQLGRIFGNKDHTSILHAWRKITILLGKDDNLKNTINYLTKQLNGKS